MNDTHHRHLRDPAELEGALFVDAQPLDEAATVDSTIHIVQPAVGIPDYSDDTMLYAPDERRPAREGTLKGRQKAEAEIALIQRTNRDAALRVKMERQKVQEANARAKTAQFDTPAMVEVPLPLPSERKSETSISRPNRHSGYEVSEYKVGEDYETAPYETTEYKSVYDS